MALLQDANSRAQETETNDPSASPKSTNSLHRIPDPQYEDIRNAAPMLRGRALTWALAFVAGTGFTLFGYDQGVMSALLTAEQFERVFPQVVVDSSHPNHATLQSFVVAIYVMFPTWLRRLRRQ